MDLSQKRNLPKEPLVGHQGVGSRLELKKERNIWILRETTRSQIWKIGLSGLIGFYPMYLMLFQYEKINKQIGETFVNVIMWGASSIGVYFCLKFLLQLLQNRRIEINIASQTISFFENRGLASRKIHKNEITPVFQEREIWWTSLGENVGHEEDGKGISFERPFVVVKKFNRELLFGVPCSSVNKSNKYYFEI